jgi:hypothetical protein
MLEPALDSYEEVSGYLLINRSPPDIDQREQVIARMFAATYSELPNIQFYTTLRCPKCSTSD